MTTETLSPKRYEYECDDCGNVTSKMATPGRVPANVRCVCGAKMGRNFGFQSARPSTWADPIYSDSAGCHPDQIADMEARNRRNGDNVTYVRPEQDPDRAGMAIFESRAQRRKFLKNNGLVDKQGGYGD